MTRFDKIHLYMTLIESDHLFQVRVSMLKIGDALPEKNQVRRDLLDRLADALGYPRPARGVAFDALLEPALTELGKMFTEESDG